MLRRTPITLLLTAVAAIVFVFAATNSYPCDCTGWPAPTQPCDCTADKIARGECFITSGGKFTMEIIPDPFGNFPWTVGNDSVFWYRICQPNPTQQISHIDIQVGEPCGITPVSSSPTGTWITTETGESSTRFGAYDKDFDIYKWGNLTNFCYGEISLSMNGKVFAAPNQMLLKFGSSNFPVGKILGPSCFVPDKVANLEEVITYETLPDDIRCIFDQRGNLIDCYYGDPPQVLKKYPVTSVTCTLTGTSGTVQMPLEYVSDRSKIAGHDSPGAVWYTYRGKLMCKEVPPGSGGCP